MRLLHKIRLILQLILTHIKQGSNLGFRGKTIVSSYL